MNTSCSSCTSNKTENNGLYNLTDSTDPTIKGIQITGSQLVINYSGGSSHGPSPGPSSGSGTCIPSSSKPPPATDYCKAQCNSIYCKGRKQCNKECCNTIYGSGYCEWKYDNPCDSSPCQNEGTCTASSDYEKTGNFKCACKQCYKGDTCETLVCASGSECQSGSEGCVAGTSGDCKCTCDTSNCYSLKDGKCELCASYQNCPNGQIKNCNNGSCECIPGLPEKVLIGYWGTNSSPPLMDAVKEGKYNVIMFTFAQFEDNSDGSVIWCNKKDASKHPSCGNLNFGYPTEDEITYLKDNNIYCFLSLFGAAKAPPYSYSVPPKQWASNAISSIKSQYPWIVGLDLDVENSWGSALTTDYIYELFKQAKDQGFFTSMAPQTTSLDPTVNVFTLNGGGANGYFAFVTGSNIDTWDLISPQLYNNTFAGGSSTDSAIKYANALINESTFNYNGSIKGESWEGGLVNGKLVIKIPIKKLVLGFPATECACSDGCVDNQGGTLSDTCKTSSGGSYYKPSSDLQNVYDTLNKQIRGFMTWSIGWDWNQGPGQNTYKFGKEVSSILGL